MSRVVDEAIFQEGLEFRGAHARCLSGELIVPDFPMSRIGRVTDFCYADGDAVDDLVFPGYAIDARNVLSAFCGIVRTRTVVSGWPKRWKPISAVFLPIKER